ncbi:mucin-5AC-like isoform X2 [Poeciliopsis prolifica]|uniref:mucin-5AC-like isoform X2 n=1 Tax=Poeciliopsis prolifica TaxID=188132 RepID=UPI002413EA04|nr:mucin-5AC-like isoform X2 [Poeciliopsis prolifica]
MTEGVDQTVWHLFVLEDWSDHLCFLELQREAQWVRQTAFAVMAGDNLCPKPDFHQLSSSISGTSTASSPRSCISGAGAGHSSSSCAHQTFCHRCSDFYAPCHCYSLTPSGPSTCVFGAGPTSGPSSVISRTTPPLAAATTPPRPEPTATSTASHPRPTSMSFPVSRFTDPVSRSSTPVRGCLPSVSLEQFLSAPFEPPSDPCKSSTASSSVLSSPPRAPPKSRCPGGPRDSSLPPGVWPQHRRHPPGLPHGSRLQRRRGPPNLLWGFRLLPAGRFTHESHLQRCRRPADFPRGFHFLRCRRPLRVSTHPVDCFLFVLDSCPPSSAPPPTHPCCIFGASWSLP